MGVQQGTSLLTGLGILDANGKDTGKKGPFNIELFAGSPDDNNATFFFNGAMSVLQPYIDKGTLVVSGQTTFQQVAIQRWQLETAQDRMETSSTGSTPRKQARRRALALRRSLPRDHLGPETR